MDSPAISLQQAPHVDPQRHHYHHNVSSSSFQQHLPQQPPFTYADYGFDDGRFYSQQQQPHAYHPYLTTPPSTTTATTEDSSHNGGGDSPFDDENQLPTPEEFRAIVDDYLNNLSPKKRDKALVDQHRYYLIQQVLRDPRNTAISTAQFRFWVKKMFQLQLGTMDIICHDNKPVAVKEQIYDILVRAHREAHHGGRDKTSALVRRKFSWIPKELVARFVRHCPFCITRRNGGQSPSTMKTDSPQYNYTSTGTPITMAATPTSQSSRHFSFDHNAPSIICTPTIKEKNDMNTPSGPPSAENGYDHSPHYVTMPYTMSSSSSPRRMSYFHYDRDDEEFLNSYRYDTNFQPQTSLASMIGFRSASSSTTTNTSASQINNSQSSQQQNMVMNNNCNNTPTTTCSSSTTNSSNTTNPSPPLFYPQQNYMYPPYSNGNYYPNMLGITACGGANDAHRPPSTSVSSFSPQLQQHQHSSHSVGVDLLDHHHQDEQPAYFNPNNPLVAYANPISDPAAAAAAAVAFGSGDL